VKYTSIPHENTLTLPINLGAAVNDQEVKDYEAVIEAVDNDKQRRELRAKAPKYVVPFESCVSEFLAPESVDGFFSQATRKVGRASKTTRIENFPPYLLVKLRRYVLDKDWTAKKLDARVDVPRRFDFASFRAHGLQPGEVRLPGGDNGSSEFLPDEGIVLQIVGMGFSENAAKRAAIAVKNSGFEAAVNWVFSHMEDPDFNDPIKGSSDSTQPEPDANLVMMLEGMGFTSKQAKKALKATNGDLERAGDWLFSRMGTPELEDDVAEVKNQVNDGGSVYELVGIISHIGTTTYNGHYVCHILKDGQWVIFNDSNVAKSQQPPFDLGYLYLFRRV